MRFLRALSILAFLLGPTALAGQPDAGRSSAAPQLCEHGVRKALCVRCNPKLAPVFKSKGDWCVEHERPESQCVLCNPELAKKGVK